MLVKLFSKEEPVEIIEEENSKAPIFKRVFFQECPVCHMQVESDLLYHAPSACGIEFACGHSMHSTPDKTTYYLNGVKVKSND